MKGKFSRKKSLHLLADFANHMFVDILQVAAVEVIWRVSTLLGSSAAHASNTPHHCGKDRDTRDLPPSRRPKIPCSGQRSTCQIKSRTQDVAVQWGTRIIAAETACAPSGLDHRPDPLPGRKMHPGLNLYLVIFPLAWPGPEAPPPRARSLR